MNVFFKLTKLIFPVLPTMLLALLLAFLTVASSVSLMAAAAYLIARAALHPMLYELSTAIVGVRFFGIARAVCRYGERYVSHDATFRILTRLRVWCYAHIEPLAPARLRGWQSGELFGLLTHEIDLLKDFYLRVLAPPLTAALVLITLAIVLSFYAPISAILLAVSFLTIALVLPLLIYRLSRAHVSAESQSSNQFKNHCIDLINGMTELTAFNHAKAKLAEIEMIANVRSHSQAKIDRINALTDSAAGLIANLTILCALIFWIPLVTQHQISGVQLAVLTLVMQSSFEVVLVLPVVWQYYTSSIHAARQIFSLAESKPPQPVNAGDPARCTPPIRLEITHLRFAYDDDQTVLTDLSFTLRPNERIAIVGASGAGKSTLINLLLQLWEPNGGTIQMNGVDYYNLSPTEIRNQFNVVTQHTHIFHGSIKDNLRILHPDVSDNAIWAALKKAELCEFVAALPDGLDTDIGQNGRLLSGGQRQRLALARAFLSPAPILLLDEPTAGLDMITAAKIMLTIEESRGEGAMLLITHQLHGLECMDRILVLHDGKIAEQGNFFELLAKDGMFSAMWNFRRTL